MIINSFNTLATVALNDEEIDKKFTENIKKLAFQK